MGIQRDEFSDGTAWCIRAVYIHASESALLRNALFAFVARHSSIIHFPSAGTLLPSARTSGDFSFTLAGNAVPLPLFLSKHGEREYRQIYETGSRRRRERGLYTGLLNARGASRPPSGRARNGRLPISPSRLSFLY